MCKKKKYTLSDLTYIERDIAYYDIYKHKIKLWLAKKKYKKIEKKLEKDGVI
jgi:hypothetical protein